MQTEDDEVREGKVCCAPGRGQCVFCRREENHRKTRAKNDLHTNIPNRWLKKGGHEELSEKVPGAIVVQILSFKSYIKRQDDLSL